MIYGLVLLLQGKSGELRYSLKSLESNPVTSDEWFYVNPTTGEVSVKKSLKADTDRETEYLVRTSGENKK